MENICLQYENSLTRQAEESMDIWTKELADMSEELMNDPMAVVRSLNDARNLCTAGFLMRRQIQSSGFLTLNGSCPQARRNFVVV